MGRPDLSGMYRICFIAPGHRSLHVRIYHRFGLSLSKAGHEVHLIAHPEQGVDEPASVRFHPLQDAYSVSLRMRPFLRLKRSLAAYRSALRIDADLYHFFSPEFLPFATRLKKNTGRPVLFDCMEDFESYVGQRPGIPRIARSPITAMLSFYLRQASCTLDAITVADPGTGNSFQRGNARVVPILNLPKRSSFPDSRVPCAPTFDLVFHGTMSRQYLSSMLAIDDALTARNTWVRWNLFGIMVESEWFKGEIEKRRALNRFTIGGPLPHAAALEEARRAKIGLIPLPNLPKYYNNIPQKLFEYMGLRMPVVTSDLPPIRPFVGDGRCAILVPPDDADAYAVAVKQLLDNPGLREAMGHEGRRRVEESLNWEVESVKLLNLYCDLLGRSGDSRAQGSGVRQL